MFWLYSHDASSRNVVLGQDVRWAIRAAFRAEPSSIVVKEKAQLTPHYNYNTENNYKLTLKKYEIIYSNK